ncbi:general secretion pathway protein GspK [Motiliproteus sp. SC1-56]|uniref:general secretion pathway protein GspK n=1 Tax=Motiliproteus sp. SC1-56 TaxID=2799565 RepID=UPI001A8E1CFD|nr:type II secretion system protein GspK [Motiliproteus sp. SC1-56]
MSRPRRRQTGLLPTRTQQGVALLTVLWLVGLVTLLAGSFSYMVRTETQLAKHQLQAVRSRLLAEAGTARAIFEVAQPAEARDWRLDGAENRLQMEAGHAAVRIQNASGFIDLNRAGRPLLSRLFQHLALPLEQRDALIDTLQDWRDSNDLVRLNGAEDRAYLMAGRDYGAKDADFEREDELLKLLGVTPALYRRIRPYVTVHSGMAAVNPAAADSQMLLLLAEGNARVVKDLLAAREQADPGYGAFLAETRGLTQTADSPAFVVRAEAVATGGGRVYREIAVNYDGRTGHYRILSWEEGSRIMTGDQG